MIEIVEFNPRHLKHLDIQEAQQDAVAMFDQPDYVQLLLDGQARTVIYNGEVITCAGVFTMTQHLGRGWALLSKNIRPCMLDVTRATYRFLISTDYARIDTPVRRDFVNGHRWCKAIGFTNETPNGMKYYGFEGETYDLYALYPQEHKP